jgi:hypothetical protein
MVATKNSTWPALPFEEWRDTYETLHMWTQIVGKVCLALTPRTNHFWNVAFQLGPRGLVTPLLRLDDRSISIVFNFLESKLEILRSDGSTEFVELRPRTVASFYSEVVERLKSMGIDAHIWTMPVEYPDPIRFELDEVHRSYDAEAARRFWRALLAMKPVFDEFRCDFIGKCSPLHFFWGSFDLALTRFSGRLAPARPGADSVTDEAYSHEVISHGFWPGSGVVQQAAFYSYASPEPDGFRQATILPAASRYVEEMSLFVLPYDAVRMAASPESELREFLKSTYDAAANLGGWDRASLERVNE